VTTQAEAIKAARTYRETQPQLDELKGVIAANKAAKKVLGEYMVAKDLSIFKGVELSLVPFEGWDNSKLREFLGDKVAEFRGKFDRKYFKLHKRAKAA
jgi:hypothetical protein